MTIPPNTFKQYYLSLNSQGKTDLMDKTCAELAISQSTFYRRLNMTELYSPLERSKIAEITGCTEGDLFTSILKQTA